MSKLTAIKQGKDHAGAIMTPHEYPDGCYVNYAWRCHKQNSHRFANLERNSRILGARSCIVWLSIC